MESQENQGILAKITHIFEKCDLELRGVMKNDESLRFNLRSKTHTFAIEIDTKTMDITNIPQFFQREA